MRLSYTLAAVFFALGCSAAGPQTAAISAAVSVDAPVNIQITLGPEQATKLPSGWQFIPDEHTSIIPPAPGDDEFLVFTAGAVGSDGGAIAMFTSDFLKFKSKPAYSSPVMSPSKASCAACIINSTTTCKPSLLARYDNGYAAPGSVLQDPAAPDGTYLMFYEAENHCRGGEEVGAFYASVGFARSTDFGQTWPAPAFVSADRYAVITSETPDPLDGLSYNALGTAIPSAIVDGGYFYVYFTSYPGASPPSPDANHAIEVARAIDDGSDALTFNKFSSIDPANQWIQPGLGGIGSPVITPPPGTGCGQASVNRLELEGKPAGFVMTMMCGGNCDDPTCPSCDDGTTCTDGKCGDGTACVMKCGAWYYSQLKSKSLADQDWTAPILIDGSEGPICNGTFDGWYPSFVSKTATTPAGTLDGNDVALYANGDLTGARTMGERSVTISAQ